MTVRYQACIVNAAVEVAQATNCELSKDINEVYEEFAEVLYECTTSSIGTSQLRFSLMYHVPIMGSAHRICSKSEKICTSSPTYEIDNGLFICTEDLEELSKNIIEQGQQRKEEIAAKQTKSESRITQRHVSSDCKKSHPLGWGLHGNDVCCCGNYPGCCYFALSLCCTHDEACECCHTWWCGWQCVKSPYANCAE